MEIAVVLRTGKELAPVVAANPYAVDDPTKVVVTFLAERRPKKALGGVDQAAFAPDEFTFKGRELYLKLPNGQARSKLIEALAKQDLGTDHDPQLAHRDRPRRDDRLTASEGFGQPRFAAPQGRTKPSVARRTQNSIHSVWTTG